MTVLYLVRHAKSAPSESVPEPEWPLTAEGLEQAQRLRTVFPASEINAIYSSPFPRALDTVRPLAVQLGLTIQVEHELRERKLGSAPIASWLSELEKTWKDFDYRSPGGETSRECQNRVVQALIRIASANKGRKVIACSHGNALALALHSLSKGEFGFASWNAMRNPDVFRIKFDNGIPSWDRSYIYPSHDG